MTGKARERRTTSGITGRNKDDINKLFNVRTRNKIVTPTQVTLPSGGTNGGNLGNYLPLSGGVMAGVTGGQAHSLAISVGDLDLTADASGNAILEFPIIFVSPESGITDTLDTITISGNFPIGGRILLVGVTGNTITITNNSVSGSGLKKKIISDGANNLVLTGTEAIEMFYDIVSDAFHVIIAGFANPATEDLDMDTFNVIDFGFLAQGGTEATAGAIRLINNVGINWRNVGNTANLGITLTSGNQFLFDEVIDMNGKEIILDVDADTKIGSTTDDSFFVNTGGSTRLLITNTAFDFASLPLNNASNINLDGGGTIKSDSAVEIAYQVTNGSQTVGLQGSLQAPVYGTVTTSKTTLDTQLGNLSGNFGFIDTGTGNITLYFRQANGNWAAATLTRDTAT